MGSIVMTWSSLLRSERHSSSACLSREALEKVELFGEEAQLLVEPCLPPHVYCEIKQIVSNRRTLNGCKDAVQLALSQSSVVISTFDLVGASAARRAARARGGKPRGGLLPGAVRAAILRRVSACATRTPPAGRSAPGARDHAKPKHRNAPRAPIPTARPAPHAAGGAHAVHLALLRGRRQRQLGQPRRAAHRGLVAYSGGDGGAVAAAGPVRRAQGRAEAGAGRGAQHHHARHTGEGVGGTAAARLPQRARPLRSRRAGMLPLPSRLRRLPEHGCTRRLRAPAAHPQLPRPACPAAGPHPAVHHAPVRRQPGARAAAVWPGPHRHRQPHGPPRRQPARHAAGASPAAALPLPCPATAPRRHRARPTAHQIAARLASHRRRPPAPATHAHRPPPATTTTTPRRPTSSSARPRCCS
jgi:hypothetical protein